MQRPEPACVQPTRLHMQTKTVLHSQVEIAHLSLGSLGLLSPRAQFQTPDAPTQGQTKSHLWGEAQEPQHAAGDAPQDGRPRGKGGGVVLVQLVAA